jgi:curved DNA-binding protein CbpA
MNLYEILEVSSSCSTNEIKKSYYRLAKIYHPDKQGGSTQMFQRISYAYNILINDKTRNEYNMMSCNNKSDLMIFLEKWLDKSNIKTLFKFDNNIIDNIDNYDLSDIIQLVTKSIIPNKKNTDSMQCSDSDIDSWDCTFAEYYDELPLKYQLYSPNNIQIELKCSLDDIIKNTARKIKINRHIYCIKQINTFKFKCSHQYTVFNNGGDIDSTLEGHLIIRLILPPNYELSCNNIIYRYDINLYEFLYGVDVKPYQYFNLEDNNPIHWISYRDGQLIYIEGNKIVKLNLIYSHDDIKKNLLQSYFIQ